MSDTLEPAVIKALTDGNKIAAIKELRIARGIGLKEAKTIIDDYCANHPLPKPAMQKTGTGIGVIPIILFLIIGYWLYYYFGKN